MDERRDDDTMTGTDDTMHRTDDTTLMTAVALAGYGGPEVLRTVTMARPRPADGEVLIEVHAASVNRPDVSYRQGFYDPPPGASRIPGLDVSGVVVAVGDGVSRWRRGDAVCALTNGGGYAQYCVVPAGQCLPCPAGLGHVESAALPEVFFTAYANLMDPQLGRLAPAEAMLVQGGTSGVGIAAIQLARSLRRAHVVATASTGPKRDFCRSIGAEAAVDYRDPEWTAQARAALPDGFDLVLDSQGAAYVREHLALLRTGGRLVLIATHGGTEAPVDLRDLMRRRLTLTGSTLRPREAAFKALIAARLEAEVWPLIERGAIRMPIDRVLPLADAAAAHHHLETAGSFGKVVLAVR